MHCIFLLFVVFLQVLTALCTTCRTYDDEIGTCIRANDCPGDGILARCATPGLYCCPSRAASTVESKFPSDCGDTPMYAREHIVGGKIVRPDEYSWLASLQYGNQGSFGLCGGSVINARYVLTAAHCVTGEAVTKLGGLTGVRLGDYDEKGQICDYGTNNCTHYQQFGIEKIISHSSYTRGKYRVVHDIALIRLNRSIQFGPRMKPICLPFGSNNISEPSAASFLIVTGWGLTMDENEFPAKREVTISLCEKAMCNQIYSVDETHICAVEAGKNSCNGDSGGPLMYQFAPRRMVLEGIVSYGIKNCRNTHFPGVYTRVRSYGDWLDQQIEM